MSFYFANPADKADIRGNPARNGQPYLDGKENGTGAGDPAINPWTGESWSTSGGREKQDFYFHNPATNEAPAPSQYYRLISVTQALVGPVQTAGTTVDSTNNWSQLTLDELLEAKRQELAEYTLRVSEAAFEHDIGGLEFWVAGDQPSDTMRGIYNGYLGTRHADLHTAAIQAGIDTGGNTNAEVAAFWAQLKTLVLNGAGEELYWTRDIKVALYDRLTLQQVRDNANQNQWSGIQESAGTFEWQWRNANDRVEADFVTAYDDSDWMQLALIQVDDPAYNWPPFFDGQFATGRTTIAEMQAR